MGEIDPETVVPRIFVGYRRADTGKFSAKIYADLATHFGAEVVFQDVADIEAGLPWSEVIDEAIASCDVFVVLIGNEWLDATDEEGNRRLDDPADRHRREIEVALERGIRVFPVLIEDAAMPRAERLPETLRRLHEIQSVRVTAAALAWDMDRLIGAIERAAKKQEVTGAPDPRAHPPEQLAKRIRAEGAALAGEQKQVTALSCGVVGSLELAERLGPERWREIIGELFKRLADAVHRYEGTVDKFTGDGLMALFGAPIAHEDHARRACLAALEMQERIGELAAELRRSDEIELALRIGINSGEVVFGSIGEDLSLEYTAIGHTVGLAQRIEALAEPGAAYLTEHTARLAAGYLELTELGELELEGASEPVRGYALAGTGTVRGGLDLARRRGLSRFVGRAEEIAELEAALERALGGEGQAVGIVAEAGSERAGSATSSPSAAAPAGWA